MPILTDDIIRDLTANSESFVEITNSHIFMLSKKYGCIPQVSRKRLEECYGYWTADIERALREGFAPEFSQKSDRSLDIFKYAGFLSFWLRRFTPITKTTFIISLGDRVSANILKEHHRFAVFGNEIIALLIGVQLCAFHEINRLYADDYVNHHPGLKARMMGIFSSWPLMRDYVMIFKHKPISPYSIYLIYKSMFRSPILQGHDYDVPSPNAVAG